MNDSAPQGARCPVCGRESSATLVPLRSVRPEILALVQRDHPDLSRDAAICPADVHRYRMAHLAASFEAERGEVSALDREVLDSLASDRLLAENVAAADDEPPSLGERVADRVAAFGGSWTFILSFFAVLVVWIALNAVVLASRPFDPYPFILLNLVLSMLAAIQAPVILMSQNRTEVKDRIRAEHDYQVNLKAEIEVRMLHEKLDHLMVHQWQRLLETQQGQAELLDEIVTRLDAAAGRPDERPDASRPV